mmetsp:Transcript_14537/g.49647  ORF Transcript_14537/g.49647 Transcript_14537/m.49647 type:complete len:546 (-) Transcript_14537:543-2180(-)
MHKSESRCDVFRLLIPWCSWSTYQNRSNLQKSRREGKSVKEITVQDAIKELEEKASSVHRQNLGGRISLWGQWSRRMEDNRLDADLKYVDNEQGGSVVSFDEVFIRSRALEEAVASLIRNPVPDDTEITFLFSHCLEGDALFHRKLAEGFKTIGECFRESGRTIPEEFVGQILVVVTSLKVNPKLKRTSGITLNKIDDEISFNLAKAQELQKDNAMAAKEAMFRCTSELVRLGLEKNKLLSSSTLPFTEAFEEGHVRAVFEEMNSVISAILQEATTRYNTAEMQYETFQSKIKTAMMGDDAEYLRVVEEDQRLDTELARLMARKRELQAQLEEVSIQISSVEQKKRNHHAASHKIMATYHKRMKSFQGEDDKMSIAYKNAKAAFERCQRGHSFVSSLCDDTFGSMQERTTKGDRDKKEANKQLLQFISTHLEAMKASIDLVHRRFDFCRSKLDGMRSELQEAKEIGLADLAADLASAIGKFEEMQVGAYRGLDGSKQEMKRVHKILSSLMVDEEDYQIKTQIERDLSLLQQKIEELETKSSARVS